MRGTNDFSNIRPFLFDKTQGLMNPKRALELFQENITNDNNANDLSNIRPFLFAEGQVLMNDKRFLEVFEENLERPFRAVFRELHVNTESGRNIVPLSTAKALPGEIFLIFDGTHFIPEYFEEIWPVVSAKYDNTLSSIIAQNKDYLDTNPNLLRHLERELADSKDAKIQKQRQEDFCLELNTGMCRGLLPRPEPPQELSY